jgi:hypothetical protein
LHAWQRERFKALLPESGGDLIILGDLFDGPTIDTNEFWSTYLILDRWISDSCSSGEKNGRLILVRGNHDIVPQTGTMSHFDLLAEMLSLRFPAEQFLLVREGLTEVREGVFVIPHMPNQELFDAELDKALALDGDGYLCLHCNMLPPEYYGKRDHSLSVSQERAEALAQKFVILNGHEHQYAFHDIGKGIYCLGNQFPSSVADCLPRAGYTGEDKCCLEFHPGIAEEVPIGRGVITWQAAGSFYRADWRGLETLPEDAEFVRVEGTAQATEAEQVIDAIARLRREHRAFVIANAVAMEGMQGIDEAAEATFEGIRAFDALDALLAELSDVERARILEVLKDEEESNV